MKKTLLSFSIYALITLSTSNITSCLFNRGGGGGGGDIINNEDITKISPSEFIDKQEYEFKIPDSSSYWATINGGDTSSYDATDKSFLLTITVNAGPTRFSDISYRSSDSSWCLSFDDNESNWMVIQGNQLIVTQVTK